MRSHKTSRGWRLGGLLALALLSSCVTTGRAVAQPSIGVSVEVFDSTLSPYGEWVFAGRFGRVWHPYPAVVGVDFRPYLSAGHWEYTDYGWAFESDYPWGWAAFHYGRWVLDPYYGWVWVPDTVWGPAWVDWRFGNGYVGWVPLAPAGFYVNYEVYRPAWCFVPVRQFVVRDVYHYALPVDRFHWAYSVTTPLQQPIHYAGARWNGGPPPGQISQVTGQPVHAASITPPQPGRVQPVRIGAPSAVPAHTITAAPTPGSPAPAYPPHPSTARAPGYVAPAPIPSNGRPGVGGSVSPAPPPVGATHPVSPAPHAAPGPAPSSIHPSAPAPQPAPAHEAAPNSPGGKQGFYSPHVNQGPPQIRATPSFGALRRPSAPLAQRSAPAPRSFPSLRHN